MSDFSNADVYLPVVVNSDNASGYVILPHAATADAAGRPGVSQQPAQSIPWKALRLDQGDFLNDKHGTHSVLSGMAHETELAF
jgi:hypothetical protein